ncbi:hypothetical protein JCM8547_005146 [Rhodosporidiobolus lusitaniae]
MSWPTVPSGANPYEVYQASLISTLYPVLPPHTSFSLRAFAFTAVAAYGILISLFYGLAVAVKRKDSRWIVRKVDRYLTLNRDFWVPLGGVLGCASMLIYLVLQHHLFTHPGSSSLLYSINTFRSWSWIPLVLHGYFVSASAAQASLVVSSRSPVAHRPGSWRARWLHTPSSRVANAAFWTGLVVISLALLLPDLLFSISWSRVYDRLAALESFLKTAAAAYAAGTSDVSDLLRTSELYKALSSQVAKNKHYQTAVVYALIIVPLFLALITFLSCLLLHSLLSAQIRARSARQTAHSTLLADVHTFTSPAASTVTSPALESGPMRFEVALPAVLEGEADAGELAKTPKSPPLVDSLFALPCEEGKKEKKGGAQPSSSGSSRILSKIRPATAESQRSLPAGARAFGSFAIGAAEAQAGVPVQQVVAVDGELGELKRAYRELAVCAAVVLFLTLALAAENIWNVLYIVPTPYVDLCWAEIELSYFLPPALYVCVYSLAPTLLLLNLLLSPASPSSAPPSSAFPPVLPSPSPSSPRCWTRWNPFRRSTSTVESVGVATPLSGVGLGLAQQERGEAVEMRQVLGEYAV